MTQDNPSGFTSALEAICRERCASFGDPPCWRMPDLVDDCPQVTPCPECWSALLTAAEARAEAAEARADRLAGLLEEAVEILRQCTWATMYTNGQYVDREDFVDRADAALAKTEKTNDPTD